MSQVTTGGYLVDAKVQTPLSNKDVVGMSDYFVHAIPYNNTFGCPGIITNPDSNHGGSQANWNKFSSTMAFSSSAQIRIR